MATVAEHPNATLFRRGYEAFSSGDLDTLRSTFQPDIVWHVGGRSRYAGDKRGIDSTLAFFVELTQITDGTFRLDVHDIVANDEHAVALVNAHNELGGTSYDQLGTHVAHVKDGRLSESWFFNWDPYPFDEQFPA